MIGPQEYACDRDSLIGEDCRVVAWLESDKSVKTKE